MTKLFCSFWLFHSADRVWSRSTGQKQRSIKSVRSALLRVKESPDSSRLRDGALSGGLSMEGVQGVNLCLSQTLHPSLTWNHFGYPLLFLAPSYLSSQPASWRQYWVSSPAEGLPQSNAGIKDDYFSPLLPSNSFFRWEAQGGRKLLRVGWTGAWRCSCHPCLACWGGRRSGPKAGQGETWALWKRLRMTQEKLPLHLHHPHPQPVRMCFPQWS